MSKKALLIAVAVLMFASISMAQPIDWWFNKDIVNLTAMMEPAWDLAVIIPGYCTVDSNWHYDGYWWSYHFHEFATYPIGDYRCIHWADPHYDWDPNPPNPIPFFDTVHVGARGWGRPFRFIDMYWTNQWGARIPWSIVWNATTGEIFVQPPYNAADQKGMYYAVVRNAITPVDESGKLISSDWAGPRAVTISDLMYVLLDEPLLLDDLCGGSGVDTLLEYLYEGDTVVPPRGSIRFLIPELVEPGQYLVFCWDNIVASLNGSDQTWARDYIQLRVPEPEPSPGVEERGSVEPEKFLEVTSYPDYAEIRYALPKASHVNLVVYSVTGERVATLVDETSSAGEHTVCWDGGDAPAGLYFCHLSADGIEATEKMIRLK